jgi:hypothetical protein
MTTRCGAATLAPSSAIGAPLAFGSVGPDASKPAVRLIGALTPCLATSSGAAAGTGILVVAAFVAVSAEADVPAAGGLATVATLAGAVPFAAPAGAGCADAVAAG